MEKIISKKEGNVGKIIFNNEESLNSFDNDMLESVHDYLTIFNEDQSVQIILIEGSENLFSAGDNLKGMSTEENPDPKNLFDKYIEGYPKVVKKIRSVNKPVIAFVKKFAYGAAFEIVLACDYAYVTKENKFGLPFVKRGISSGTSLLLEYVSYKKAVEILFTGRDIYAKEAKELGFITEYGVEEDVEEKLQELIQTLSVLPTETIGLIKRSLNNNINKTMNEKLDDQCLHTNLSFYTKDFREGHDSFTEKREPIFNRGDIDEYKSE